jgi:hypothetical protein
MKTDKELEDIINNLLDDFYKRRIKKLSELKLRDTIKRKNPYLFKAIGTQDAAEIVESLLSAFMSSSDEGIFGDAFFEPLAREASGFKVSDAEGVDITSEKSNTYTAVAVKSGTSVFNAASKKKQSENFQSLQRRIAKLKKRFDAIVGYCYGRKKSRGGGQYSFEELAGQDFWTRITGDEDFYLKIIRLMKRKPQEHKVVYQEEWDKAKNRFTSEFTSLFCKTDGSINWDRLAEFNSGSEKS